MLLLGKALGNGFHVGAALMKQVPEAFYHPALIGGAGDTELTYAAGCAVFEELLENGLLEHIRHVSAYLEDKLTQLQTAHPRITRICCKGLAASMEFETQALFEAVQKQAKEAGLILGSGENRKIVLRPPYVITGEDVDEVISIFRRILDSCPETQ